MPAPRRQSADERAAKARASELRHVLDRMTERKGASSVTVKVSAQGQFMPEITIAANEDDAVVTRMVEQAVAAYVKLGKAVTE